MMKKLSMADNSMVILCRTKMAIGLVICFKKCFDFFSAAVQNPLIISDILKKKMSDITRTLLTAFYYIKQLSTYTHTNTGLACG